MSFLGAIKNKATGDVESAFNSIVHVPAKDLALEKEEISVLKNVLEKEKDVQHDISKKDSTSLNEDEVIEIRAIAKACLLSSKIVQDELTLQEQLLKKLRQLETVDKSIAGEGADVSKALEELDTARSTIKKNLDTAFWRTRMDRR